MENWEKKNYDKVKELVKKGWLNDSNKRTPRSIG
jgi:hypothetical protein